MILRELIDGLPVKAVRTDESADVRICDVTDDSRTVMPGSLFVARPGMVDDGRKFIPDAVHNGAVAILTAGMDHLPDGLDRRAVLLLAEDVPGVSAKIAERFFGSPSSRLTLIGVTGTNGKTTVTHLVHHLLNAAGIRCGLIGTVAIDDGREFTTAELTTPPALEISRTLCQMLEAGCAAATLEVSSHAIVQKRTSALNFDIGIFTNLSGDHLDYHGSMEAYAEAKADFFRQLSPQATAVVNADDPYCEKMLADCRAQVRRCTFAGNEGEKQADASVRVLAANMTATEMQLLGPWGEMTVTVPLVGEHNAMNVLQAATAAYLAGVAAEDISQHLAGCHPPPGRLEAVTAPDADFAVFVDYAHTDDALRNVLRSLRPLVKDKGKLRVVFGAGGDRDREKRPRMAEAACKLADEIIITSDNPRSENPELIIDEIMQGVPYEKREHVRRIMDRGRAIRTAIQSAQAGDIVIIAGKGHEDYQIIADDQGGTRRIDFDDRLVARTALAERGVAVTTTPVTRADNDDLLNDEDEDALDVLDNIVKAMDEARREQQGH